MIRRRKPRGPIWTSSVLPSFHHRKQIWNRGLNLFIVSQSARISSGNTSFFTVNMSSVKEFFLERGTPISLIPKRHFPECLNHVIQLKSRAHRNPEDSEAGRPAAGSLVRVQAELSIHCSIALVIHDLRLIRNFSVCRRKQGNLPLPVRSKPFVQLKLFSRPFVLVWNFPRGFLLCSLNHAQVLNRAQVRAGVRRQTRAVDLNYVTKGNIKPVRIP